MNNKKNMYDVSGKILSICGDEGDGDIRVSINEKELECFIPDWRKDEWYKKQEQYKSEKLLMELSLMNSYISKSEKKEKDIILKKPTPQSVNQYEIHGEIIEINPHENVEDYITLIIDCGINLRTSIQKSYEYNIGDYIIMVGRLDAKKVEP